MLKTKPYHTLIIVFHLVILLLLSVADIQAAKKKDRDYALTESELQAKVMSFADRYSAVLSSAFREYEALSPSGINRRPIHSQIVYSMADAFTIAAGPDPDVALLDMVVMVTIGRMVFEEHYTKKYGSEVAPLVKAFQTAERDIWQIASEVLDQNQLKQLRSLIEDWRGSHPDVIVFSLLRFSEFESSRRKSGTRKTKTSGGLFQSVEKATAQVEEARLLAERGIYLGTRIPLLAGAFANVWVSSLAVNPEMKAILADLHRVSEFSERLAVIAEDLPQKVATERQAAIRQVMREISIERKSAIDQMAVRLANERQRTIDQLVEKVAIERRKTIEEFINEEKRMRGLLTDLKQTLTVGNDVLISTNTLVERLSPDQTATGLDSPLKPFDIQDYRAALQEASTAISQLHDLIRTVNQMGLDKSLPLIVSAFEKIEQKGEQWVLQAFMLGVMLILIFLIGAVFAMVLYRYMTRRMFQTDQVKRVG